VAYLAKFAVDDVSPAAAASRIRAPVPEIHQELRNPDGRYANRLLTF